MNVPVFIPRFSRSLLLTQSLVKQSSKVPLNLICSVNNVIRQPNQTQCVSREIFSPNGMKMHFHSSSLRFNSQSSLSEAERLNMFSSQMNMRLVNENSFLSWCRNAYLSTVVGIAMMEQAASTLAQGAGFGAFLIGGMNLYWGTGCHVTNLIRLKQISGMSNFNLFLNVCGSLLHCLFYSVVLIFYIGFLDERSSGEENAQGRETQIVDNETVYKV